MIRYTQWWNLSQGGDFEAFKRELQEAFRKLAESKTKTEFDENLRKFGLVTAKVNTVLRDLESQPAKVKELEDIVKQIDEKVAEVMKKFLISM